MKILPKRTAPRAPSQSTPGKTPPPRRVARGPRAAMLAIGDLAREFAISTRAIRFYEMRGLITPERRGLTRMFGPSDRQRLAIIIRAKNLGLTLEEIGEHLAIFDAAAGTPKQVAALRQRTERHIETLVGKREDLQATLKELRKIRARLTKAMRAR